MLLRSASKEKLEHKLKEWASWHYMQYKRGYRNDQVLKGNATLNVSRLFDAQEVSLVRTRQSLCCPIVLVF